MIVLEYALSNSLSPLKIALITYLPSDKPDMSILAIPSLLVETVLSFIISPLLFSTINRTGLLEIGFEELSNNLA
ncbi:MAG: hypothetical protein MJ203_03495 [archaeon]|nr:hypothetical protein [archaeon]